MIPQGDSQDLPVVHTMVSQVIVTVCDPEMQMGLVFPLFLKEITKPFADLGNRLRFSSGPFAEALGISIHFTIFQKAAFRHLGTAVFGVTTSFSPSAYGLTWLPHLSRPLETVG